MLIKSVGSINFARRFSTPVEKIPAQIKSQLPARGICVVSACNVIDEAPADYFEVTQDDGATKYVTKFVDGKKVTQEAFYDGKSAGVEEFDDNGEVIFTKE